MNQKNTTQNAMVGLTAVGMGFALIFGIIWMFGVDRAAHLAIASASIGVLMAAIAASGMIGNNNKN